MIEPLPSSSFIALVRKHFDFVQPLIVAGEPELLVKDDFVVVSYVGKIVVLNVIRMMPDYDVRLEFGIKSLDLPPRGFLLDAGDIIQTAEGRKFVWRKVPATFDAKLGEFARMLREAGGGVTRGDSAFFEEMRRNRRAEVERANQLQGEAEARRLADAAWHAGDRAGAAERYSALSEPKPSEQAKIRFARKKQGHI